MEISTNKKLCETSYEVFTCFTFLLVGKQGDGVVDKLTFTSKPGLTDTRNHVL